MIRKISSKRKATTTLGHNSTFAKGGKALKRTKMKAGRKESGQAKTFREIWDARPHACEVCKVPIHEATASNFSHLLPKGSYPELKNDPRNIVIKCKECHDLWHKHGAAGLRYSFQWIQVVRKRDALHAEAHGL